MGFCYFNILILKSALEFLLIDGRVEGENEC